MSERNGTARATLPDAPPPFPELAEPTPVQLQKEYVAGGQWGFYGGRTARTLPNPIDDVTTDFGADLYDRMMVDPQIAAVVTVFKASILETGPEIKPAVTDENHPDFELSVEICDQTIRMLEEMDGSFNDTLWDLESSVAYGNRVAEKTYKTTRSIKGNRVIWVLDKLKVKPRSTVLFAVDNYMNVVGLLVAVPPNSEPIAGNMYFQADNKIYGLVPKSKFVISQFRVKDSDPRGTSILRPAYSPWWRKQQIIPEYLKYLSQFAGPSLVGKVGPNAMPVPDPADPTKTISPTTALLAALEQFRNMTAIAVADGTEIEPIVMQGDGAAFRMGIAESNQEITKAVLTQELATEEGKHMARAAATVHQDVLDTIVRQGKLGAQDMIRKQILRPFVILNWGEKSANLTPIADLGATEQRDKPGLWQGAAALANAKFFTEDQLQELDQMLGLPVRQRLTALAFQLPAPGAKTGSQPAEPSAPDKVVVKPHERNRPQRVPPPQPNDNAKPAGQDAGMEDHDDDEFQTA